MGFRVLKSRWLGCRFLYATEKNFTIGQFWGLEFANVRASEHAKPKGLAENPATPSPNKSPILEYLRPYIPMGGWGGGGAGEVTFYGASIVRKWQL